jgi:hypothetical protein
MKKGVLFLLFMAMICFNAFGQSVSGRYVADDEDAIYQYFEFTGRSTVRIGMEFMGYETRVTASYKIEDNSVIITNGKDIIELEIVDNNTLVGIGFGMDDVRFIKR